MDNFEIDEILKSMEIVVDNREHKINRAERRYKRFGVPYSFGTLSYGDYTYNAVIDGQKIYDNSATILGEVVIERKMSLDELAMCFTRGRERFKKEFQRATEQNAKVYLRPVAGGRRRRWLRGGGLSGGLSGRLGRCHWLSYFDLGPKNH